MKRILLIVCALALLVAAGCGANETALTEKDLDITVGGVSVTTQSDVSELLEAFGAEYEYYEAISCVYDGMDKTYAYSDFVIYTFPSEQGDLLMEVYCMGGGVTTAKGVTIGTAKDEVISLYGKNYVEKGATVCYELPLTQADCVPASLYFLIENDCVSAIGMTAEHRME